MPGVLEADPADWSRSGAVWQNGRPSRACRTLSPGRAWHSAANPAWAPPGAG